MRIGIDARFYGTLGKGLGRYTQQLIHNLEQIDHTNEYVIFLRKENFSEYEPTNERFRKVLADIPWYGWKEQLLLPRIIANAQVDVMHFPHFNVPIWYLKPFVVTIHDLILLHYPTIRSTTRNPFYYWFKFFVYKRVLRSALVRAQQIITVSKYTKQDLQNRYTLDTKKMNVTYQASSSLVTNRTQERPSSQREENGMGQARSGSDTSQIEQHVLRKYGIIEPYILYVGNAYPHKNLDRLIAAFQRMDVRGMQLVLVGKIDHFYEQLVHAVQDQYIKNVIFTDGISDHDLDVVYRGARMYVFPSLYEGFGLPPLEAMMRRIPVASSDRTSMPEVLSDAAYYFDPEDVSAIRGAMERLHKDTALRELLVSKGVNRAGRYSWKKMAQTTKDIYEKIQLSKKKNNSDGHYQKENSTSDISQTRD